MTDASNERGTDTEHVLEASRNLLASMDELQRPYLEFRQTPEFRDCQTQLLESSRRVQLFAESIAAPITELQQTVPLFSIPGGEVLSEACRAFSEHYAPLASVASDLCGAKNAFEAPLTRVNPLRLKRLPDPDDLLLRSSSPVHPPPILPVQAEEDHRVSDPTPNRTDDAIIRGNEHLLTNERLPGLILTADFRAAWWGTMAFSFHTGTGCNLARDLGPKSVRTVRYQHPRGHRVLRLQEQEGPLRSFGDQQPGSP